MASLRAFAQAVPQRYRAILREETPWGSNRCRAVQLARMEYEHSARLRN